MFPFDPPENIRKILFSWCFQGDQKGTLGRKGVKRVLLNCSSERVLLFNMIFLENTFYNFVVVELSHL